MNTSKRTKTIVNIYSKLESTNEILKEVKDLYATGDVLEAEDLFLQAAIKLEKTNIESRNFAINSITNKFRKKNYYTQVSMLTNVKAGYNKDENLLIELPGLLPFKKILSDGETESQAISMRPILTKDLQYFKLKQNIPTYEKVLVVINNVVNEDTPRKEIPDTDNYEYKALINELTAAFIVDDSFDRVSTLHMSTLGKRNRTQVLIIPIEDDKELKMPVKSDFEFNVTFNRK